MKLKEWNAKRKARIEAEEKYAPREWKHVEVSTYIGSIITLAYAAAIIVFRPSEVVAWLLILPSIFWFGVVYAFYFDYVMKIEDGRKAGVIQ